MSAVITPGPAVATGSERRLVVPAAPAQARPIQDGTVSDPAVGRL